MEPLTSYLFPFVFHLFDLLFYFLKDFPDFIFYTFYWYFKFSATLFLIFKNCFLITVQYFVWVFLLILWMHLFLFSLWGYQSMFCFLLKIILLSAFSIFSLNHLFLCLFLSILANSGQCIHVWMLGLSKLIGICVYEHNLSIGGSHHGVTRLQIRFFLFFFHCLWVWRRGCIPGGSVVKNMPANAGDTEDAGSIPGSGRSPGAGNGNPIQYSCLENPMDVGAW